MNGEVRILVEIEIFFEQFLFGRMSDENVHRLEGSGEVKGGLIIRKKKVEDDFKAPKASLLGLDKLAALKEKERKENEEESSASKRFKSVEKKEESRKYRGHLEETPTYTGGVHSGALEKRRERDRKERDKGIVVTSKEDRKSRDSSSSSRDRHRFGGRERDRERDRRHRHDHGSSSSRSSRDRERDWEMETPR